MHLCGKPHRFLMAWHHSTQLCASIPPSCSDTGTGSVTAGELRPGLEEKFFSERERNVMMGGVPKESNPILGVKVQRIRQGPIQMHVRTRHFHCLCTKCHFVQWSIQQQSQLHGRSQCCYPDIPHSN